jgi:hypothetical protein
MPAVDSSDFYMFRSYETGRDGFTTIIANYYPLQDPFGGPNYYTMDPNALYEIQIDNDGDAVEDVTFQFRFSNVLANGGTGIAIPVGGKQVNIPLVVANANGGAGGGVTPFDLTTPRHVEETYGVKVVRGPRRTGMAADITHAGTPGTGATFVKPIDNIGQKTFGEAAGSPFNTAKYEAYANAHIYGTDAANAVTIPGCAATGAKIFVGQRHDMFAVNLGTIFDLVNATVPQLTDAVGGTNNLFYNSTGITSGVGSKNVTSIALEIPTSCLTKAGGGAVIGGWTTASVRQARVINPTASYAKPTREGGAWTQVSRLGNPLVNEVVIGLKDKDHWGGTEPKDDAQFNDYVTNPTLPVLIQLLLGSATYNAPNVYPRADLVQVFATGVPGVNAFPAGAKAAEMLRLNTALPAIPASKQFRGAPGGGPIGGIGNYGNNAGGRGLGAAGCFTNDADPAKPKNLTVTGNLIGVDAAGTCDPSGFPNGRRPGDDVVDLALRVVSGYLLSSSGQANLPFGDFVQQQPNDQFVADPQAANNHAFPYLPTPLTGAASP